MSIVDPILLGYKHMSLGDFKKYRNTLSGQEHIYACYQWNVAQGGEISVLNEKKCGCCTIYIVDSRIYDGSAKVEYICNNCVKSNKLAKSIKRKAKEFLRIQRRIEVLKKEIENDEVLRNEVVKETERQQPRLKRQKKKEIS